MDGAVSSLGLCPNRMERAVTGNQAMPHVLVQARLGVIAGEFDFFSPLCTTQQGERDEDNHRKRRSYPESSPAAWTSRRPQMNGGVHVGDDPFSHVPTSFSMPREVYSTMR